MAKFKIVEMVPSYKKGQYIKDQNGELLTWRDILIDQLNSPKNTDQMSTQEKLNVFSLSEKINSFDEVDLDAKEITLIHNTLEKVGTPLLMGRAKEYFRV